MIETVKLAGKNTYVINDAVKLYNITVEEEYIFYDVDFDEKALDEKTAVALCDEFLQKAFLQAIERSAAKDGETTSSSD